jgi:hypothetical protein
MAARTRAAFVAFAVATALVVGVTAAQAANVVPNPGFETACGNVPCNWTASSLLGSTISRDTTIANSGAASLALTANSVTGGAAAISDCITVSANTTYNVAFWYETFAANLALVGLFFNTFTSTDCSGTAVGPPSTATTTSPVDTETWTEVTGQVTTNDGVQSAQIFLDFSCTDACGTGTKVNFDDVIAQTEALGVTVRSFSASRSAKGVVIRWRTASETDVVGFNLFRNRAGTSTKVNSRPIAARSGSARGSAYRFLDRRALRAGLYSYRLEAIHADGSRSWLGRASVRIAG